MSWGSKRRNTFLSIISIIFFVGIGSFAFLFFYEEPNCFDAKRNNGETGIDCGGRCELLCSNETFDLIPLWHRYFEVAPGIYNVLALIENPNIGAGSKNVSYTFDLVDEDGITLDKRKGSYNIKPKEIFPVFESNLETGQLKPSRLKFDMQTDYVWERDTERPKNLIIMDEEIDETEKDFTKITAKIQNSTISIVENIKFVIVLYDENNNAFAASSTLVEEILGSASKDIVFTWPKNFNSEISKFEIIPLYE